MSMIVTIDGPAGAGKSSVARAVAEQLGFRFLDTGAMYRAVTWAAVERHWTTEAAELAKRAAQLNIEMAGPRVLVDGHDVTNSLRSSEISRQIHRIADNPDIRHQLVQLQRQLAQGGNVVTEGRDQGTVAFPHADCKIFLTASPQQRAQRRLMDLQQAGEQVTLADVLADQERRDQQDRGRTFGALQQARDAVVIVTDGMEFRDVVDQLVALIRRRVRQ